MKAEDQWFIKTQSGKSGPFDFKQLQYFADRGKIKPNTAIGRSDSSWVKAKRVDGLYFPGEPPRDSRLEERPLMPDSAVEGLITKSSPFGIAPRDSELSGILKEQPRDESISDVGVGQGSPSAEPASDDPPAVEPSDVQPSGGPDQAGIVRPAGVSVGEAGFSDRDGALATREAKLATREADLAKRENAISDREADFARRESTLRDREVKCDSMEMELRSRESDVACREADAGLREADVSRRESELRRREAKLLARESESAERNGEK